MDERPSQPTEIIAGQPLAAMAGVQERPLSHFRLLRARARLSGTSRGVVHAGLIAIVATVVNIVLQLVTWVVLT
jgi:hypothetical protein